MTNTSPATGHCRCGRVEFTLTAPALITSACHCLGCRRMSGSAYSLTASYPREALHLTRGQTVLGGLCGPILHHHHCDHCKSWLYTTIDGVPFVNVRSPLVDPTLAPFIETHTAEKLPWVTTPAAHRFETAPDLETFHALMADYPAWAEEMRLTVENGCSAPHA